MSIITQRSFQKYLH